MHNEVAGEQERLSELKSYHILDTLSEKEYDDITKMASIICDAPVALISFVDEDRQWFKSHNGVEETETPREYSFCAHAIHQTNNIFIVPDSRLDDRFKNNPLVTGYPGIVFYAGMPLVSKNGYGLGTVCVIDDKPRELNEQQVTALKILSDQTMNLLELHKLNYELSSQSKHLETKLDEHITERIREVAAQNIALEKANKELESFTYISGHDLQEPLRKIQAFISVLEDQEHEKLTPKAREYFSKISRSADRMSALIKALLNYSRSTNTEKEFEVISLSKVFEEVKAELHEETETANAQLTLINDMEVNVIPFQMKQLLYNIISNALKFSKTERLPVITVNCSRDTAEGFAEEKLEKGKAYVKISVADNGTGFDNVYSDKIFEIFQRLDREGSARGTGVGLAIVKKIADNHQGVIIATGTPDEGARFDVYIPDQGS